MSANRKMPNAFRLAATLLLCGSATLLAGCSQEFASVDDVYVPVASDDRFPISVVDKPYKLTVSAKSGKLAADDMNRLASFARDARSKGASPVIVSYPSGSKKAAGVARQAAEMLRRQGVDQSMIRRATYNGKSDVVALSFTRRLAETKPCGDWSQDLSTNSKNESFPDAGCSIQNNLAAMAVNPDDFLDPRLSSPRPADARTTAIQNHQSGAWTNPANSAGAEIDGP